MIPYLEEIELDQRVKVRKLVEVSVIVQFAPLRVTRKGGPEKGEDLAMGGRAFR